MYLDQNNQVGAKFRRMVGIDQITIISFGMSIVVRVVKKH